jgi:hypothetical protein
LLFGFGRARCSRKSEGESGVVNRVDQSRPLKKYKSRNKRKAVYCPHDREHSFLSHRKKTNRAEIGGWIKWIAE